MSLFLLFCIKNITNYKWNNIIDKIMGQCMSKSNIIYVLIGKQRAEEVFKEYSVDHLVVSAGSGVTSSPIIQAFQPGNDLFSQSNKQAHTVTVSNINTIYDKYKSHSIMSSAINVDKTKYEFDDMMNEYEVPFPCNGTWDRKAWWWLEQNIEKLEGDILFWNIGGNI